MESLYHLRFHFTQSKEEKKEKKERQREKNARIQGKE